MGKEFINISITIFLQILMQQKTTVRENPLSDYSLEISSTSRGGSGLLKALYCWRIYSLFG